MVTSTGTQQTAGIAGAGLMGRLMAFHLAQAGYRVTLFDRDRRDGQQSCAWVAGGMLSPLSELEKAEPIISKLGMESLSLWPAILEKLPMPVFFATQGSLVVAHRQDMGDLESFRATVSARLPEGAVMQSLDAKGIAQREPDLSSRFSRGIYFPCEAQLEPLDLLPALEGALLDAGVVWQQDTEVVTVEAGKIHCASQTHSFDLAVDTRGLGARKQLPLRGVRGEVMRFYAPDVKLRRMVRLMHPRYPLYIVPRPNDVYLIGATSIESDHEGPVTVRSALELLSAVYSLHTGFAEASVLSQLVGCRPAFDDNLPRVMHEPGLLRINGLYRHGFLISPALAKEAMALLCGNDPRYPEICEVTHASTHR